MRFCDKLPKLRKEHNLSQEQLADRLGVSRQAVSKWESGSSYPDMDKMLQMCHILNCHLDDLLDDGVIENNDSKKNKPNNYLQDLLNFLTRTVNMFGSMKWKEKIKCVFEMIFIIFMTIIIGLAIYTFLNSITYNLLSIVSIRFADYTIVLFRNIYTIGIIILGFVIVLHLFKIRYLDYFITIEDQTIQERNIEKSIEPKEKNIFLKSNKERIVIRDPKHSTFSFFQFLGKIISFISKIFIFFVSIPVLIFLLFFLVSSVMSFYHSIYNILFFFVGMALLSCSFICFILIYFAYHFLFDRPTSYTKAFFAFSLGILLIGISIGLSVVSFLSLEYQNEPNIPKTQISYEYIDVTEETELSLNDTNFEVKIDNSLSNIKLEIRTSKGIDYHFYHNNNIYRIYLSNIDPLNLYHYILEDIKNKKISSYSSENFIEVIVYMSEDTYQYMKEKNHL